MLSYKLKHLCSRVIASLSAVGLISITNTGKANAGSYPGGATVTNTYMQTQTFTATYATLATCSSAGGNIETAIAGELNGKNVCTYILKPGYGIVDQTGNCTDGSGNYKTFAFGATCTEEIYSGVLLSSLLSSSSGTGSAGSGYSGSSEHLADEVVAYYNSANDTDLQYAYVVTVQDDGSGKALLNTNNIVGRAIRINFSCGAGTQPSSGSGTGFAYVRFGKDMVLPSAYMCTPPNGQKFTSWSDGQ